MHKATGQVKPLRKNAWDEDQVERHHRLTNGQWSGTQCLSTVFIRCEITTVLICPDLPKWAEDVGNPGESDLHYEVSVQSHMYVALKRGHSGLACLPYSDTAQRRSRQNCKHAEKKQHQKKLRALLANAD